MLIFAGLLIVFHLVVILYKPPNISLKQRTVKPLSLRLLEVKGTLLLGTILIVLAMVTCDSSTLIIRNDLAFLLGLSKHGVFKNVLLFQVFTSNFIHFDIFHVVANCSALLLLAGYERRIGMGRFLMVFIIPALGASCIDLFLIRSDTVALGASAGIAGLACGYFIDYEKITFKDWVIGALFSLLIIGLVSLYDKGRMLGMGYEINWISHLTGVVIAALFIKIFSLKTDHMKMA